MPFRKSISTVHDCYREAPITEQIVYSERKKWISEHPDAEYLKRDDLGLVVAKGLAVMYKT